MSVDLRLGRWQDALADVESVDAVITDPPYSERTHAGQRTGSSVRSPTISYSSLTESAAHEFAGFWCGRARHWVLIFSDHTGARWHESAWESVGWYVFAPLAYVKDVYAPRLSGDGPALGCEWLVVARPSRPVRGPRAGSRPGWYLARGRRGNEPRSGIAGQKDIGVVRAILRDYTLPGDLVCDPFSGSGTTARACVLEGRSFIGAEMDPNTHRLASERLAGLGPMSGPQGNLFAGVAR